MAERELGITLYTELQIKTLICYTLVSIAIGIARGQYNWIILDIGCLAGYRSIVPLYHGRTKYIYLATHLDRCPSTTRPSSTVHLWLITDPLSVALSHSPISALHRVDSTRLLAYYTTWKLNPSSSWYLVQWLVLRYFCKYPAMGSVRLLLGCMVLAAGNVNWRLWNKLGPRQCV